MDKLKDNMEKKVFALTQLTLKAQTEEKKDCVAGRPSKQAAKDEENMNSALQKINAYKESGQGNKEDCSSGPINSIVQRRQSRSSRLILNLLLKAKEKAERKPVSELVTTSALSVVGFCFLKCAAPLHFNSWGEQSKLFIV